MKGQVWREWEQKGKLSATYYERIEKVLIICSPLVTYTSRQWLYLSMESLYFEHAGVKFIVIADLRQTKVENLLRGIYELYSDYVLENPFYSLDMPIRYTLL